MWNDDCKRKRPTEEVNKDVEQLTGRGWHPDEAGATCDDAERAVNQRWLLVIETQVGTG